MSTLTITIKESPLQLLAGIPSNVTLETNIPATIFYTLDGSDPSTSSSVAFDIIDMPTNSGSVVLKAFATDGVDTSPVITQQYTTNIVGARNPHDKVYGLDNNAGKATFPFGSPAEAFSPGYRFGNAAGPVVDNQEGPRVPTGYNGFDGYAGYQDPTKKYQVLFSETDDIGQRGRGLGTLPAHVVWVKPRNDNTQVQSSNAAGPLFDPRALVIYQDSRDEQYDPDVPKINRPYFDLEDQNKARDGSLLTNIDAITPQGGFLKAHFNPTDNTLTYYYYDNRVSRWIISKEPYSSSMNPTANLSGLVTRSSRGEGLGLVFKWIPFAYRRLI